MEEVKKSVVTVSRRWDNPEIKTTISNESISLEISLEDFKTAMLAEIGSVTTILTREQFKKRFETALVNVIAGVKEESIKVV